MIITMMQGNKLKEPSLSEKTFRGEESLGVNGAAEHGYESVQKVLRQFGID